MEHVTVSMDTLDKIAKKVIHSFPINDFKNCISMPTAQFAYLALLGLSAERSVTAQEEWTHLHVTMSMECVTAYQDTLVPYVNRVSEMQTNLVIFFLSQKLTIQILPLKCPQMSQIPPQQTLLRTFCQSMA